MKSFNPIVRRLAAPLCVAALMYGTGAAWSQIPGADKSASWINAAMIKLLGPNTNFISKADLVVLDKNQKETTDMPIGFQILGNKMRWDYSASDIKSKDISPESLAGLKAMGMDQMITIWLPKKQTVLSIYPTLKSYLETPMSKDEIEAANITYTLEKARLGKETIDGHPCEKNNITLADVKGNKHHPIVWNATDMKDEFPVQMLFPSDDVTEVMKFRDIKIGRPDASHFEVPAGMTKFDSITALISDAATKHMSATSPN